MSIRIETIVLITLLIGVLVLTSHQYYSLAEKLYYSELERGGKGYVSDEVWYVNSARNIYVKILKNNPRLDRGVYGVSIVYNSSIINITYVEKVIRENNLYVNIVDKRYYKINAVYVESRSLEELLRLINILNRTNGVLDTIWGWRIGDHRGINEYFNLEHPPLFKYLVLISIHVFGDNPVYWRIPSIVAGLLTVLFTFLASFKLISNKWLSLVIALFTGIDPIMRTLSSVALIDIYVALFTSLTMYLVFSKKYKSALFTSLIGSLFKLTSLFLLLPILILIIRSELKKKQSLYVVITNAFTYILISLLLFICLQIIASIPLITYFGFKNWFYLSFINALKWHISVKCIGAGCPVSSAPWDWFIGHNGFALYYFTTSDSLVATGFWPMWTASFVYMLILLPIYRLDKRAGYIQLFFTTLLFSYILLYVVGNRTQYSFYAVQFTPVVYLNLIYSFTYIVLDFNKLRIVITYWRKLFSKVWLAILWILSIEE